MDGRSTKQYWEQIYQTKDTVREVSWYQDTPKTSINLILSTGIGKNGSIIDVGGGDSKLVDKLLELNFKNILVLDISAKSLQNAKARLRDKAKAITWIESDVLEFETDTRFDVWHDRATFHFLTKKEDIARYVEKAGKFLKPSGYLIISTFSVNGPKKCSGLDIRQYSEDLIKETFEKDFRLGRSFEETHTTPFSTEQNFLFSIFKRK